MVAAALAAGEELVPLAKRTGIRLEAVKLADVPGTDGELAHVGVTWSAAEDAGTASARCPLAAEARAFVFSRTSGELVVALPPSPYRESVEAPGDREATFVRMYDAMAAMAVPRPDGTIAWCAARRPTVRRQTLEECLEGFGGREAVEKAIDGPCTFLLVHHCLARFDQSPALGDGYATARLVSGTCPAVPESEAVAPEDVAAEIARPGVLGVLATDARTGARTALMTAARRAELENDAGTGVDARIPVAQRALRAALEGRELPEDVPEAAAELARAEERIRAGAAELARLANATTTVGPRPGWMRVLPGDRALPGAVRFHLAQVREVMRATLRDLTGAEAEDYLRGLDVRNLARALGALGA